VVTASDDQTARTWDAATGKPLATLQGHTGAVNAAAFSPDGSRVVTASFDGTARTWDAASGKPLATLQGHTDRVISAAFSPDGSRVVTASDDQTARIWALNEVDGDAAILPLWVEAYTGTELPPGGLLWGLTAEAWEDRCRQLRHQIEQGARVPRSKWLDTLLARP
jgi:WD40 repeat protein